MTDNSFDAKDLLSEKKLWDVYVKSRCIPYSRFNVITTFIVFAALSVNALITTQPIVDTIDVVRTYSDSGLSVSLSTLGFLLAGFTIFATVSQPSLSLRMAEITRKDSGLSYLKHNYFVFLRVFIFYLAFAIFCLMVITFGHKGGLVPVLVSMTPYPDLVKFTVVKISYVVLFTGYYFLIMQLKSFIFNIYHAVMTSLRWKAEGYE
ncbi:MAG: hypothetical protein ABW088_02940 [Sedimenticola sp.]